MNLHIVTLLHNGMPWLPIHISNFNRLRGINWDWSVIEGRSNAVADTAWVKQMPPSLSTDGSHEYMLELAARHPRVRHFHRASWPGKTFQLNQALSALTTPGILLECDVDEIWLPEQIETLCKMFEAHQDRDHAYFHCRYFLGANKVITSQNTYGNHDAYEWLRAWRYTPGTFFTCHEPPKYGQMRKPFTHAETESNGLVFDHYAYATEAQVAAKEEYYKYPGAVEQWRRLQDNQHWPVKAKDFLKWITDETVVDILK